MRLWAPFAAIALGVLVCACSSDVIVETSEYIPRVTLLGSSLTVDEGGSGEILFMAPGDVNVAGPKCHVSLRTVGGTEPDAFSPAGVSRGYAPGLYSVRVQDSGKGCPYSVPVRLELSVEGHDALTCSDYICVNSGATAFGTAVNTGLPVIYIDTFDGGSIDSRSVSEPCVLKVKGVGEYENLAPAACTVRGRGNISWNWPKKPYRVHFRDAVPLLGMPAHGEWVLLANYSDRTLMRTLVSMKVSSLTSLGWTPRCVPVELVLNGSHVGNYLLMEQVAAGPGRVDISPEGFLLELDFHMDNGFQWIDRHGFSNYVWTGVPFAVKYPDADVLTAERKEYIIGYVDAAAGALYGKDFADPVSGYAAWLDVRSFADYWLVFEVLGNYELGNPGSVFMHKDRDGLLTAGPCWDFDWGLLKNGTDLQEYSGLLNRGAIWYARLFQDPAFEGVVRARFAELLPSLRSVSGYIDSCRLLLAESARLNFSMWDPADDRWQNKGLLINGDEELTFDDAVVRLRETYLQRLEMMKKFLSSQP